MSHENYSEYEVPDREIEDYLDEIYPEPVYACGMAFTQSRILKELDEVAFSIYASENMNWYQCDVCGKIYKTEDSEEDARECCQEYCEGCEEELNSKNYSHDGTGYCDDCKEEE